MADKSITFSGTLATIVLPGIKLTETQETQLRSNIARVLCGEAVAATRDSICGGIDIGPISISYCHDVR